MGNMTDALRALCERWEKEARAEHASIASCRDPKGRGQREGMAGALRDCAEALRKVLAEKP